MKSGNVGDWLGPKLTAVKFLLEVLTLVAVAAFAALTYQGWQAMEKSNVINRINAEAAQSAATTAAQELQTSTQSFQQEERAYLWPSSFGVTDETGCPNMESPVACANVHIANSGRTPTIGVHLYCFTTLGPDAGTIANSVKAMEVPAYSVPDGDMFGSTGDKWKACAIDADDKTAKGVLEGKAPVYVYGLIQYFDIFSQYHETGFCSYRLPNKGPFVSCQYGNWFDKKPVETPAAAKVEGK